MRVAHSTLRAFSFLEEAGQGSHDLQDEEAVELATTTYLKAYVAYVDTA